MMRFNQSVVVNNILTVLSDAARQNKLGGFKVNPDSIKQVFLPSLKATSFAVIPYNQGVTGPIKRITNSHNVKVGQKPFQTLWHIFAKPKDPVTNE